MEIDRLEAEKRELESANKTLEHNISYKKSEVQSLQARLEDTGNALRKTACEKNSLKEENSQLKENIKELESRPSPIEIAPATDDRLLRETIASLEREAVLRNEELEQQYRDDEIRVREMLEREKQEALDSLRAEYEDKLSKQTSNDDQKSSFKNHSVLL